MKRGRIPTSDNLWGPSQRDNPAVRAFVGAVGGRDGGQARDSNITASENGNVVRGLAKRYYCVDDGSSPGLT